MDAELGNRPSAQRWPGLDVGGQRLLRIRSGILEAVALGVGPGEFGRVDVITALELRLPPDVTDALRAAAAPFDFVHGSRTTGESARAESDLDIAAWWGSSSPHPLEVAVPDGVDLVVLDRAPLWPARRIWLDERPQLLQRQHEWRQAVAAQQSRR